MVTLRLEAGGRHHFWVGCACFLITLLFLNVFKHAMHRIEAVYLSYSMVYMYIKICFA